MVYIMKNFFTILLILITLSLCGRTLSQNFWQQTNGPYGGATVHDFLKYADSTIFIATGEGLIKSTDNGDSWNRINTYNVTCLGTDKLNTVYFGTSGHLKRSTDGGSSWIDIEVWGAAITDFIIPFRDTIYVGSGDNGVFRSLDYGETWEQINNGIEYSAVYEILLLSNGELFVGSNGGGVYKSTNCGESWSESNNGIPATSQGYRYAESFLEDTPGQIFTGTHSGIYYSTNYGDNWIYKGNGIVYNSLATCIAKDDLGILYAGIDISHGVYFSTNNGNQWQHLGLGYSIYTLGWDSDSRLYAGGSSQGLNMYIPEDTSWVQVYNRGYTLVEVLGLALTKSENILVNTKWWGFHYTTDDGENWQKLNYNAFSEVPMLTINDSIIIIGSYSAIFVSNDTGKTWSITGNYDVRSLFYDSVRKIVYVGTAIDDSGIFGIFKSTDYGQSWELLYAFPNLSQGRWVNTIHVSRNNHYVFASIIYGDRFGSLYQFFRSTDEGQSWELIIEGPYSPVFDIEEDFLGNIYALRSSQLLISHDEGNSWIYRNTPSSNSMSVDYSGRIYLSYYNNLHFSVDEGITWLEMDKSGLQGTSINDIKINKNNRIYLATKNGVFIGEADSIVLSTFREVDINKSFVLAQNYPNPFNPSTKIKFTIPTVETHRNASLQTTLKVFDVLGNEISTLVNEEKPAGNYEVEFDAAGLPSGIYFYQLKAGSYIATKKMLLLK
jgi:photosystem II stability/assembly factor-like uncharacterized protein